MRRFKLKCLLVTIAAVALILVPGISGAAQLLANPGFENGTNAAPWVAPSGVINDTSAGRPAHSGSWYAWLNGRGTANLEDLFQQVTIPSGASATLTFWLRIDTAETSTAAIDTLKVQVRNSSNALLSTLTTYSNLNAGGGYAQKSFDLSAYAGQTIRVFLRGVEDASLQTSFVVDDFALTTGGGASTPTITAFTPTSGAVGTSVTITGTNLTGATAVKFNGTTATFTPNTSTQITAAVPQGATTGPISVTTPGGTATSASNFTVTSSGTQLLANPGFENGTNAAPWVAPSGVINDTSAGRPAHSGSWYAWLNGRGTANLEDLFQQVTIPSGASATLTFWLRIDTAETSTAAIDTLKVQVRNSSNALLSTLTTYSNLNAGGGYAQKSFDLSAYAGQTIRVFLRGVEDASLQTSFVVDDFALTTGGGASTPTITAFTPTSGAVGTSVTITGTNLTGATAVKFNGTTATFTPNTSTQITAAVPQGATTGPISVTTPGGTATSASNFTVTSSGTVLCQGKTATQVGTQGADTINGTNAADVIASLGGDDVVHGLGGDDFVCAGDGDDQVFGDAGADLLRGEAGDFDFLNGGAANDTVDGGAGIGDEALFVDSTVGVSASLGSGLAFGQGSDRLIGMEGLIGSQFNDQLTGDELVFNFFVGLGGNDTIDGAGAENAVLFTLAPAGVSVNLANATATGEGSDTLTSIQSIAGSPFVDTLVGNGSVNTLLGDDGNDTLMGGAGDDILDGEDGDDRLFGEADDDVLRGSLGNDTYTGGPGTSDWATFETSLTAVNASLATSSATGEGTDGFATIENLVGTPFNDVLTGNASSNQITGEEGNDTIVGGGANDLLIGGPGTDSVRGDLGQDFCEGETRTTCEYGTSVSPAVATATSGEPDANAPVPPNPTDATTSQSETGPADGGDSSSMVDVRQALSPSADSSSVTAQDEFTIELWSITINPPECHRNPRTTKVLVSGEAEGASWSTSLFYWDGSAWQWTGVSYGAYHPVTYRMGLYIFAVWEDANGNVAPLFAGADLGGYSYYRWAEYSTDFGGNQTSAWLGAHQNFPLSGPWYYDLWCYVP